MSEVSKSLLMDAIFRNEYLIASDIVSDNMNLDFISKDGYSPLMLCAILERKDIIMMLLNKGASIDYRNNCGDSVMSYAIEYKRKEIIQIIRSHSKAEFESKLFYNTLSKLYKGVYGGKNVLL